MDNKQKQERVRDALELTELNIEMGVILSENNMASNLSREMGLNTSICHKTIQLALRHLEASLGEGWNYDMESAPNEGQFLYKMDDHCIFMHDQDGDGEYTKWVAYDGYNENWKGISKPVAWKHIEQPSQKIIDDWSE